MMTNLPDLCIVAKLVIKNKDYLRRVLKNIIAMFPLIHNILYNYIISMKAICYFMYKCPKLFIPYKIIGNYTKICILINIINSHEVVAAHF